ncbi:MOSC domain-containing protein YiiM [Actinoplanes abujensis]|uniref:MOSC domain-containing protein YiiM n=1 Tax=Paractinoplanes abujensis TaxID=882441 RepID=A0A7W7CVI7_9ACTN|nr:MOSC domain-containing protein YiiM [Actinoplanes abujensis]
MNVGVARPNPAKRNGGLTGIDKLPVEHAVDVRAPGPKTTGLHSGVVGDPIGDVKNHGGNDQAVYAYSREDYDWWQESLGRTLPPGMFGENMTTVGLDLNETRIGEVWRIGDVLELQTTFGRIPCATFAVKMGEKQWLKRFAREARTGTYLRVITPGPLRTGDPIEIVHRPAESIGVSEAFDIYMHRKEELARLLVAEALPADLRQEIERRLG